MAFNHSVALAQITLTPGNVDANLKKVLAAIEEAKCKGAALILFPELTLSGYYALDLTFDKNFLAAQQKALEIISEVTKGIIAVVGFMRQKEGGMRSGKRPEVYNSAAVFEDGVFLGYQDKKLLPDYDIFDETRYFIPGSETKIFQTSLGKLGVQICEDLWIEGYQEDPSEQLLQKGADIILNLSASPFEAGRLEVRKKLIQRAAQKAGLPFVYTNLVAGLDGYDGEIVFDGRSLVSDAKGNFLFEAPFGEEGVFVTDFSTPSSMHSKKYSEPEEIFLALSLGVKSYFSRFNQKKAIVGVSGGIDSAVVLAIAAHALGAENIQAVSMPSQFNSEETKSDARALAQNLKIAFEEISIEKIFKEFLSVFSSSQYYQKGSHSIAEENLQSRIRMSVLFALSNRTGGLVLNTGNKTEFALGYSTVYGDLAGSVAILGDVNKRQVYELAKFINSLSKSPIIPQSIIERAPSAELRPNQTDAQGMGGEPAEISDLIDSLVMGETNIPQNAERKINPDLEISSRLISSIQRAEWKRRQAPPSIRVSGKAFGHGRRVPM